MPILPICTDGVASPSLPLQGDPLGNKSSRDSPQQGTVLLRDTLTMEVHMTCITLFGFASEAVT